MLLRLETVNALFHNHMYIHTYIHTYLHTYVGKYIWYITNKVSVVPQYIANVLQSVPLILSDGITNRDTYIYIWIHIYIYIYIWIHIYIYIYMYPDW